MLACKPRRLADHAAHLPGRTHCTSTLPLATRPPPYPPNVKIASLQDRVGQGNVFSPRQGILGALVPWRRDFSYGICEFGPPPHHSPTHTHTHILHPSYSTRK